MPINKETIISVFDDKLTLMQWLKTINKALEDAVLTGVEITKKGNATLSFKFTFEDGTFLETNDIVLQQGESVNGAYIQNGHLYLTLTNGNNLDAGNVKPVSNFSIDANQHLIVNYADGTSQDLGAIFQGNVNIDGNFTANSIIENMGSGYSFNKNTDATHNTKEYIYAGAVKNGNKLTIALFIKFTPHDNTTEYVGTFYVPTAVHNKLYPTTIGGASDKLLASKVYCFSSFNSGVDCAYWVDKLSYNRIAIALQNYGLTPETEYMARFEITFLLSDNLVQ